MSGTRRQGSALRPSGPGQEAQGDWHQTDPAKKSRRLSPPAAAPGLCISIASPSP